MAKVGNEVWIPFYSQKWLITNGKLETRMLHFLGGWKCRLLTSDQPSTHLVPLVLTSERLASNLRQTVCRHKECQESVSKMLRPPSVPGIVIFRKTYASFMSSHQTWNLNAVAVLEALRPDHSQQHH